MTQSPVTPQVHESLNVHRDFRSELAFDLVFPVDDLSNVTDLRFCEVIAPGVRVEADFRQNLDGGAAPDPINISQRDLNSFLFR